MSRLFKNYWPGLKTGFIICFLYPFVAYIIAVATEKYADFSLEWLLNFPLVLLLCASPLMLTKGHTPNAIKQRNISIVEKLGFLIITFWVLIPAIVFFSLFLAQTISGAIFGMRLKLDFLLIDMGQTGLFFTFDELFLICVMLASVVTVSLYYVIKVRRNKPLAGLLSAIIVLVLIPVFGGIAAVILYLLAYFKLADIDLAISYENYPLWTVQMVAAILAIIGVIYFIKLCKHLTR